MEYMYSKKLAQHNMIEIITAVFILISLAAAMYYAYVGLTKPETLMPYNKANMPRWGIQVLSALLGAGGLLLLFPQTFAAGGILLMTHSLTTIICYLLLKDWRGGFFEFVFLLIPAFLLWAGYPLSMLNTNNKGVSADKAEGRVAYVVDKALGFADSEKEEPIERKVLKQNSRKRKHQHQITEAKQAGGAQLQTTDSNSFAAKTQEKEGGDLLAAFNLQADVPETDDQSDHTTCEWENTLGDLPNKTLKPCTFGLRLFHRLRDSSCRLKRP